MQDLMFMFVGFIGGFFIGAGLVVLSIVNSSK